MEFLKENFEEILRNFFQAYLHEAQTQLNLPINQATVVSPHMPGAPSPAQTQRNSMSDESLPRSGSESSVTPRGPLGALATHKFKKPAPSAAAPAAAVNGRGGRPGAPAVPLAAHDYADNEYNELAEMPVLGTAKGMYNFDGEEIFHEFFLKNE